MDLLNEVRGLSAVMLCAGILTVLGTFLSQMTFTAHVVGALIFLGFALGRFISMSADGKPNQQIISGIVFELVLGAGNVVGLVLG
ncbi:MAG TPA: hypothetical protein DCP28_29480 [Cytophagales bacterium]|nr:hypothetical protein [Cytophagales bacterium]